PEAQILQADEIWEKRAKERTAALNEGDYIFELQNYYIPKEQIREELIQRRQIEWRQVQVLGDQEENIWPRPTKPYLFKVRENTDIVQLRKQFDGVEQRVRALAEEIKKWRVEHGRICVVCR